MRHEYNNRLTDILGLQDRSKINDGDSDNAEKFTPTQPSKPSKAKNLLLELQSRLNHKKQRIQQSS